MAVKSETQEFQKATGAGWMEIGERPEENIACDNPTPRPFRSPPPHPSPPPIKMLSVNQTSRKIQTKWKLQRH